MYAMDWATMQETGMMNNDVTVRVEQPRRPNISRQNLDRTEESRSREAGYPTQIPNAHFRRS